MFDENKTDTDARSSATKNIIKMLTTGGQKYSLPLAMSSTKSIKPNDSKEAEARKQAKFEAFI